MAMQDIAGHKLDLLTAGELGQQLHQHMSGTFVQTFQQERLRGFKLMKLPIIKVVAPSAAFTLAAAPGSAPCGPESGYIWQIPKVLITSSAGYQLARPGASTIAGPGAGSATPGANSIIVQTGVLPPGIYTVQWTVMIQTANATVANNFSVRINGVIQANSVNAVTIGNYQQNTLTVVVPSPGFTINIDSNAADATGTYNAQIVATPQFQSVGGGDSAVVTGLYVASDTNPQQQSLVEQVNINVGQGYYTGTKGLYVKSGEQLFATLSGATAGNVYTLTGHGIEVPTVMQGKLLD